MNVSFPAARSMLVGVLMLCVACEPTERTEQHRPIATQPAASPTTLPEVGETQAVVEQSSPQAIATHRGLMYVADTDGIAVWKLDGERLVPVGRTKTLGNARDIAVCGDQLAVADGRHGVAFFALDDVVRPRRTNQSALPGDCSRVVCTGQTAAVLCSGGIVALLGPGQSPTVLSLQGEPKDAAWLGDQLYVASAGEGLVHIAPQGSSWNIVRRDATLRMITSVAVVGSRLFVGLRDKRFGEVDGSAFPSRLRGEVTLLHKATRLLAHETSLLAASTLPGDVDATLLDVSTSGHPRISSRLPYGALGGVFVDSSSWVVARAADGLSVYSPTNASTLFTSHGAAWNRMVEGDGRVMAWREDATDAVSWAVDGLHTKQITFERGTLRDVTACDHAWCTLETSGRLCRQAFDADKPTCIERTEGGTSIAWQPLTQTLWLVDGDSVLRAFDVAHELRPTHVVPRPPMLPQERLSRLVIEGERAVAIEPSFGILQVFDLGPVPKRRGFFLLQARPRDVALAREFAFVAEPAGGLQVIDVRDPDKLREIHWQPMSPGPLDVSLRPAGHDLLVALAQGEVGVSTWRWTNNGSFTAERRTDTSGLATSLVFVGNEPWVADGTNVLRFPAVEVRP